MSYRGSKPVTGVDLSKKSDAELVELLRDKNQWYVRHAQRLLQERGGHSATSVRMRRVAAPPCRLNEYARPRRLLGCPASTIASKPPTEM